jgi:phenylacetate-CoA ligase
VTHPAAGPAAQAMFADDVASLVEARLGTPADRRESAAIEIAARVRDGVGVSVAVEVYDPGTLERSAGKMRRVIDQRHQ